MALPLPPEVPSSPALRAAESALAAAVSAREEAGSAVFRALRARTGDLDALSAAYAEAETRAAAADRDLVRLRNEAVRAYNAGNYVSRSLRFV